MRPASALDWLCWLYKKRFLENGDTVNFINGIKEKVLYMRKWFYRKLPYVRINKVLG